MMKKIAPPIVSLMVLAAAFFACQKAGNETDSAPASIFAETLSKNTRVLSSDEFEGRFPASAGEEKTITFLEAEFQKLGLNPGNGDSFFQDVPLVEITADPETKLTVAKRKAGASPAATFAFGPEFVAATMRAVPEASLKKSEMIFVGYGIVAPEYNWNDYQGLDVKGKTVVILINDPGFVTNDPAFFEGKTMTYYGRWTSKYEEAARQGAEGALIVHETEPAAYGWAVVEKGWSGPKFSLVDKDNNLSRCAVEGWLHLETTRKIFDMASLNFDELKNAAAKPGFKAVPLGLEASVVLKNNIRQSISRNVVARLPGKTRPDEYVIYVSHWDHFGLDPKLKGDNIYNGARDNATGTAGLIELGRAFKKLKTPPGRSVVFLAVTGEEQGLLGSGYYAANPIFAPTKTAAVINMDSLNVYGTMKDATVVGYGKSELDAYVEAAAKDQGRIVRPDPAPEKGGYFRSDHFPFAKQGIPAIYIGSGIDSVEHGEEWTKKKVKQYTAERYHKPTDEFDPGWDFSGAIEDLQLMFKVGYALSDESLFPNWKEGTAFKAKRDADMAAVKK
jgi:Zn-dependent M28 family amino/carboxypeptidase